METLGADILIPLIAAMLGVQGLMAAALIAMAFRIGRLPTREEYAELRKEVTENKAEIANAKEELRAEIANTKEVLRAEIASTEVRLRAEIASTEVRLRAEIEKAKNEVLQEIRRSHQQIMLALANHTHNADGQAVFTLPPDVELVPAPADN